MKNAFLLLLVFCVSFFSFSQEDKTKFQLTFKPGQKKLSLEHKKKISSLIYNLKEGEEISITPLAEYKNKKKRRVAEMSNRSFKPQPQLCFDKNSSYQASAITEYAKTKGFELVSTPSKFASSYMGPSIRVELKFIAIPEKATKEKKDPKPVKALKKQMKNTPLKDKYPKKPSQFFTINPLKDNMIEGNEGTKLFFPKGSLLSKKMVRIELIEYYTIEDYMKGDLFTISNGTMIKTGGTIYLDARAKDNPAKKIKINPNKGVNIDFTLGKEDPDMEIFLKDPASKETNWIKPKKGNWKMTRRIRNSKGKVIKTLVFNSKEEYEAYLESDEAKALQAKIDEGKRRKQKYEMESKLKTYDLGFINCDAFSGEETRPFAVLPDELIPAQYYIVFKETRGVLKGYGDEKISFGNVPKNQSATLVAVSFIGKQAYYYKTTITSIKDKLPPIKLEPVKESFVNKELALLK